MAETVTMTVAEANELRAIKTLMDKAFRDKTAVGASFRRSLKAVDNTLTIPDELGDQIAAPINEKLTATETQLKELQTKWEDRETRDREAAETTKLRSDLDNACKKFGLDDEGRQKVLERMAAMKNPDAEAAAAWFKSTLPKPQPTRETGFAPAMADVRTVFGSAGDDSADIDLLHSGDPMRFFDKVAARVLEEDAQAAA